MRRGSVVIFLCLMMLSGAVGVYLRGPEHPLPMLPQVRANQGGAIALVGCAAGTGLVGLFFSHAALRRLVREIEMVASAGKLGKFEYRHPDLRNLVCAVNGVVDAARHGVERAELRAKELDIQLKVVTAEREHLEAIIYSISDAVLVTDPFDEVVLANDSAARMFNFELAAAARKPVQDILSDAGVISLIRDMRASDSRGGRRIVEHKCSGPGGDRIFKVTLSCINNPASGRPDREGAGQVAGVVAVLHDMTREREVAQMKNDFVSNVSHELRTPLASIKAYAEMLIDGEATDERTMHEFYEVIHNEANRLGRLIDNILNISRIESGIVKVNKQPQSLTMILNEAIEVISPQAKQKKIEIEERISPAFYQTPIDRDMLYEVCLNLLSNAVKYTPEGGRAGVRTVVDESKKTVTVQISDTGVGIPPKDLPFIFDKFYRSDANNRMAKGTGLGLSLVKHIIETVHHGRLFVESHVGKGSTFGFELPLV